MNNTAEKPACLLTFAEAADMLRISLRQFRRLVDGGKLTVYPVSKRSPRVLVAEIMRYLDTIAVRHD